MPFTDPSTVQDPTTGVAISSSWGDQVNTDLNYLAGPPRCRVYNDANISIPNNSLTAVTFNSERYDSASLHSTASNTSRITIPANEGGLYEFKAHIQFASNATGRRYILFRVDGTTVIAQNEPGTSATSNTRLSLSTEWELAAGSYVEAVVYQNSGGALNVENSGSASPEFMARWVAV